MTDHSHVYIRTGHPDGDRRCKVCGQPESVAHLPPPPVPYVAVDTITEYGVTSRLSRSVRVF